MSCAGITFEILPGGAQEPKREKEAEEEPKKKKKERKDKEEEEEREVKKPKEKERERLGNPVKRVNERRRVITARRTTLSIAVGRMTPTRGGSAAASGTWKL
eukprot:g29976.t1